MWTRASKREKTDPLAQYGSQRSEPRSNPSTVARSIRLQKPEMQKPVLYGGKAQPYSHHRDQHQQQQAAYHHAQHAQVTPPQQHHHRAFSSSSSSGGAPHNHGYHGQGGHYPPQQESIFNHPHHVAHQQQPQPPAQFVVNHPNNHDLGHPKPAYQHHPNNHHDNRKHSLVSNMSSTTAGSSSKHSAHSGPDEDVSYEEDPVPQLVPRSKRMALGSITYSAEQAEELGVLRKDNSFYLRVEKCEPTFYHRLNYEIEKLHGVRIPTDVPDPTVYWPPNALHNYCMQKNPRLEREMYRVYRHWHDSRCRMQELGGRLRALANSMSQ